MLAADAFSAVHEVGLENKDEVKKVCKRFRSTFLASGSALPAAEVFRKFRGRDPSHEALLLTLGLKEMPKPKKKGQQIP
jgi:oligopeptidase A